MTSITFETGLPHNHVPRALDILRTMGFELIGLTISRRDDGAYVVDISYEPRGNLSEQTFVDRVAGLSAISPLRRSSLLRACA